MKLTKEDKIKIIELRNEGISQSRLSKLYNVSLFVIERTIRKYRLYGESSFEKLPNRKYSADEKLKIIQRSLNGESKSSLALILNIPGGAGTIKNWVTKYTKLGYNGLVAKQGRPATVKKDKVIKSDENIEGTNELEKEVIELRKKNQLLQMENEYLKKLDALVKTRIKQQKKKK